MRYGGPFAAFVRGSGGAALNDWGIAKFLAHNLAQRSRSLAVNDPHPGQSGEVRVTDLTFEDR